MKNWCRNTVRVMCTRPPGHEGPCRPADWHEDIAEFHERFRPGHVRAAPGLPGQELRRLVHRLVDEEVNDELLEAAREAVYAEENPAGVSALLATIADACADSIVVIIGLAQAYGIDLRPVWQEVHRANMAKVGGATREDGKIMKPEGWVPPDIAGVLARQAAL